MTPGFWRLARRPRGAYPHGYVTSGQRGQRSKDQVRLERLFLGGPLVDFSRSRNLNLLNVLSKITQRIE
jgi:hypothetical protein